MGGIKRKTMHQRGLIKGENDIDYPIDKSKSRSTSEESSKRHKRDSSYSFSLEEESESEDNARASRKRNPNSRGVANVSISSALDDLKSFTESLLQDLKAKKESMLVWMKEQFRKLAANNVKSNNTKKNCDRKISEKRKTYASLSLKPKSTTTSLGIEGNNNKESPKKSNSSEDSEYILESYVGSDIVFRPSNDDHPKKSSMFLLSRPFVEDRGLADIISSSTNHVQPSIVVNTISTGTNLNVTNYNKLLFPDRRQEEGNKNFSISQVD